MGYNKIIQGDALEVLKTLPDKSINMCMTSPPYFNQRDYGIDKQLGLEKTPEDYINKLCGIFYEVKRVLRDDGTCWVNISDCYGGFQGKNSGYPDRKHEKANIPQIKRSPKTAKSLLCVPEMFLLEMVKRGWLIRNKIIWHKNNVMPSSASDRFTIDFEMLYFFVKHKKYYFEQQFEQLSKSSLKYPRLDKGREEHIGKSASGIYSTNATVIKSIGRNKRTVWNINTKPSKVKHFAIYPEELIKTPIKAGCPNGGIVLDPFFGSGTTGLVALKQGKKFIGIELNKSYIKIANKLLKPYLEQTKL